LKRFASTCVGTVAQALDCGDGHRKFVTPFGEIRRV